MGSAAWVAADGRVRDSQGSEGLADTEPVDVCIIADDPDQQRLIDRLLDRAGFCVATAQDAREGMDLINHQRPKVILCDYGLPDGDGVQLCASVRRNPELSGVYFILMSASGCHHLPSEALNAGADDYLSKPIGHQELIARVRVGTRMWTMHDQLRRAAMVDGLTGLYNHDHFNRVLEQEMRRARRYGHPIALIMLDIDFFKAINDTFGHLVGNTTLEEIARVLREAVREEDIIGRFGGDEFTVILPEARTVDARQVADRIRAALARSLRLDELHRHIVTASLGIADSDDPRVKCSADLVDLTDRALYRAKRLGRNRVVCACELDDAAEFVSTIQADEIETLRRRVAVLSVRTKDVYVQSIAALLQALDEKDPYTARHAINVAFYAREIATQIGCSPGSVKTVYNAALLHDIGKVGIPDRILLKRQPLTPMERMVIEQVPLIGMRIVDHLRILESEIQIIRHQREHYDGSGFPGGLTTNQIPVGSRVLLVADAFDAMTTNRVYRKRRPIDEAVAELDRLMGTQFDPRSVAALKQVLEKQRSAWEQRIEDTGKVIRRQAADELNLGAAAAIH